MVFKSFPALFAIQPILIKPKILACLPVLKQPNSDSRKPFIFQRFIGWRCTAWLSFLPL